MFKYYALMIVVLVIASFYAFLKDPCNVTVKADFSDKHPSYTILDTGAAEGSPESVRCHVSYRKPDSAQVHKDIWLYRYSKSGWKFSRVVATPEREQADS
jgi:hypothetical protein